MSYSGAPLAGERPQPGRDGPHLPVGSLDPGRPPPGHHHLPRRGFAGEPEEEVGADVLLQRTEEGETASGLDPGPGP